MVAVGVEYYTNTNLSAPFFSPGRPEDRRFNAGSQRALFRRTGSAVIGRSESGPRLGASAESERPRWLAGRYSVPGRVRLCPSRGGDRQQRIPARLELGRVLTSLVESGSNRHPQPPSDWFTPTLVASFGKQ
jgi:hypothetical protein